MCGVAGILHGERKTAAVQRMNAAQRHRGPDDEGLQEIALPHGCLVLGQRRLAILDLSPAGKQPMTNPETGDCLVYNGEIYNFQELRRELEAAGSRFRSRGDTEVILHAYAHWGIHCFARLHGMFALALYDAAAKRLILARDPLGIKPLYLARTGDAFAFASELRALRASGLLAGELDRRALAGLLAYGAVPEPLTLLREVTLLEPGTYQVLDLSSSTPWRARPQSYRFWDFPPLQPVGSETALAEQVRERLTTAVRSHLVSDVPVGVFLSSGLDSNAVLALARESVGSSLDAFTVTLPDQPEMDEGELAASAARDLGIRFHAIALTDADMRQSMQGFLQSVDQPTVDGLNTYIISQAVRARGIVVALSGLGGDEIFAGYSTFREVPRLVRWHRLTRWLPASVRGSGAGWLYRRASPARKDKAVEMASRPYDLRGFYLRRRRLLSDRELATLGFRPETLDLDDDFLPPESELGRNLPAADSVAAVSLLESRFYMANILLRDADVFGMTHGLEIRVPLLDRRVLDLCCAVPGSVRLWRGAANKRLLIDALGSRLPAHLLRLKKRGFALAQARWMAGPLRELFEQLVQRAGQSGLMEPRAVTAVWESFLKDQQGPSWSRAWILALLGAWLAKCPKEEAFNG